VLLTERARQLLSALLGELLHPPVEDAQAAEAGLEGGEVEATDDVSSAATSAATNTGDELRLGA
jgi:hypothetical protein